MYVGNFSDTLTPELSQQITYNKDKVKSDVAIEFKGRIFVPVKDVADGLKISLVVGSGEPIYKYPYDY